MSLLEKDYPIPRGLQEEVTVDEEVEEKDKSKQVLSMAALPILTCLVAQEVVLTTKEAVL